MNDLMSKLMISKAIMDKTDGMKRSDASSQSLPSTSLQEFNVPQAKYNIPQEFLQESTPQQPYLSSVPNTKPVGSPTVDAIKNSKLPDEIKKLMMEHPIGQAQQAQMTISDEIVEKASRLMRENGNNYIPDSAKQKTQSSQQSFQQTSNNSGNIDYNVIQRMITEAVNNALKENGLLVESTEKANEVFTFKVGKHIFEGKVTKIKKIS